MPEKTRGEGGHGSPPTKQPGDQGQRGSAAADSGSRPALLLPPLPSALGAPVPCVHWGGRTRVGKSFWAGLPRAPRRESPPRGAHREHPLPGGLYSLRSPPRGRGLRH